MYNVKFFKYPSGWQVRVYSAVVGYHDKPDKYVDDSDNYIVPELVWHEDIQEYVTEMVPLDHVWLNPFTERFEKVPVSMDELEEELEQKKKRSIASSMGRTINSVFHIARSNVWDWFITFTFNPEIVDSFDYEKTVKKLSKWLNNIRNQCPDIGYIIVPEQHKSGRFHFHGLFKRCDGLCFVPTDKRTCKGDVIFNVGRYKFGWTTATRVGDQDRVTKYIAKYISKDLVQVAFNKRRYWASRNLDDADVQEVVLDNAQLKQLTGRLDGAAVYVKRVECSEVITTYYELPPGIEDE